MTTHFSTSPTAAAKALEQAQEVVAQGLPVEDLDFLTKSWTPNGFPDSSYVGALLRAAHQMGLIEGPPGLSIKYIEEDFDGGGSYAFFVEHDHEYDSVRILSDFGQVGRMVDYELYGVQAAVSVIEQAVQMANQAMTRLEEYHGQHAPLASQFSAEQVEQLLGAAVLMYRAEPQAAQSLSAEQIKDLDLLSMRYGAEQFSYEVAYSIVRGEGESAQVLSHAWVPMLAVDEDQAAELVKEWVPANDTRYRDGDVVQIEEIEET